MAQTQPEEEMSAAKIYDFLKTKKVPNQIFEEMLSEMKDKEGFKQVKKMIEGLISKHEGVLYNPTTDRSERASVINELCTIAFTIDTIFPNVLRMKLQQEFPKLINEVLEELKKEKKIDSASCSGTQISANADVITSVTNTPIPSNTLNKKSVSPSKNASPAIKIESEKSPTRVNGTSGRTPSKAHSMSVRRNLKAQKNLKTEQIPVQNVEMPHEKDLEKKDNDSDAESDISIGEISIITISSVHTSDLSSFDDEISISSNEEIGSKKRKISLHELKERLCQNDKISLKDDEDSDSCESNWKTHHLKGGFCAAPGCTNKSHMNVPGLSFHSFPKDEKSKKKWIEALGCKNWVPSSYSYVCSEHFPKEMMDYTSSSCVVIKENAVPSIFKPFPTEIIEEKPGMETTESSKSSREETKVPTLEKHLTSSSCNEPASPRKILPPRQRKPNSRYSENMFCPMRKKLCKRTPSSDISSDAGDSSLQSYHKKMKSETLSKNGEMEASEKEQQKSSIGIKCSADNLKKNKLTDSSDVCKPYIAVHPLTSRRAAPVKLFSTLT